jgi:hypothetical protein
MKIKKIALFYASHRALYIALYGWGCARRQTAPTRHDTAFSRRVLRPSPADGHALPERGHGECRMLAAPMARLQKKSRRQSPQVWPRRPGLPCAMVLTLMARSPWEPGFVAPIARELIISRTWPQRREARTTRFCVRINAARPHENRARRQRVHRIPRSTFVTIAKRPSDECGTAWTILLIPGNVKSSPENQNIFLAAVTLELTRPAIRDAAAISSARWSTTARSWRPSHRPCPWGS